MRTFVHRGFARLAVALVALGTVGVGWTAPASADPAGLVLRGETTQENSSDKSLPVRCPANTVVSGGGAYLTTSPDAGGRVAVDRLEPLADGSGFVATMREAGPVDYTGDWRFTTRAICVSPPAGYQVVAVTGAVGTQYVTASCGTKSVIGMGGRVNGGAGDVVLDQVVPSFDLKSVTARGVAVQGATTPGWSVTAFAVCATGVAGLERLWDVSPSDSTPDNLASVTCPAGKALYSVGADINAGNGQVLLSGVNIGPEDTVRVWADEDADGLAGNWTVAAYGICGS
ncbi:hypothetical protein AB0M79_33595 [Polymorphospora sp. NPDC051019]|uniref:hypothetical protein n=1 Tax=Polymorphospora sp. NPDC051019 TaxID=3155725 RepID=UPI003432AE0E